MVNSLMERQIETAVEDVVGETAMKVLRGVGKIAGKQGGETALENYQLLGKRTLIAIGVMTISSKTPPL